jgi:hypothetical protein
MALDWWHYKSPYWELILELKELEVLYVIDTDEGKKVRLPWFPCPKIRTSSEWAYFRRTGIGMSSESEESQISRFK